MQFQKLKKEKKQKKWIGKTLEEQTGKTERTFWLSSSEIVGEFEAIFCTLIWNNDVNLL